MNKILNKTKEQIIGKFGNNVISCINSEQSKTLIEKLFQFGFDDFNGWSSDPKWIKPPYIFIYSYNKGYYINAFNNLLELKESIYSDYKIIPFCDFEDYIAN